MIAIEREEFKTDKVFRQLYELIKRNHKVAAHTIKTLKKNSSVKNFCEKARHFVELPGSTTAPTIYLHYDVSSWYQSPDSAKIKIESIVIYDHFIEFQIARNRELNSTNNSDNPNNN